jgi:hypothetical protein
MKAKKYSVTAHFDGWDVEATTRTITAQRTVINDGVITFLDGKGNAAFMLNLSVLVCISVTSGE